MASFDPEDLADPDPNESVELDDHFEAEKTKIVYRSVCAPIQTGR